MHGDALGGAEGLVNMVEDDLFADDEAAEDGDGDLDVPPFHSIVSWPSLKNHLGGVGRLQRDRGL